MNEHEADVSAMPAMDKNEARDVLAMILKIPFFSADESSLKKQTEARINEEETSALLIAASNKPVNNAPNTQDIYRFIAAAKMYTSHMKYSERLRKLAHMAGLGINYPNRMARVKDEYPDMVNWAHALQTLAEGVPQSSIENM